MDMQNESILDSEMQQLWQKLEQLQQETQRVQQKLRKLQQEKLQEKFTRAAVSNRLQEKQLQQSQQVQEKRLQNQPTITINNLQPSHSKKTPNHKNMLPPSLSITATSTCTNNSCICKRKPKEQRTYYTSKQLSRLEEMFEVDPRLSAINRRKLATELNVKEKKVLIWFQNRRRKMKQMSAGIMGPQIGRNPAASTGSLVQQEPDNLRIANTRAFLQPYDVGPSCSYDPAPSYGDQVRPPNTGFVSPSTYPNSAFTSFPSSVASNEFLPHIQLPPTHNCESYLHGVIKETAMNWTEKNVHPKPDHSHSMEVTDHYPGQARLPPMNNFLLYYETLKNTPNIMEPNFSPMFENEESKKSRRS